MQKVSIQQANNLFELTENNAISEQVHFAFGLGSYTGVKAMGKSFQILFIFIDINTYRNNKWQTNLGNLTHLNSIGQLFSNLIFNFDFSGWYRQVRWKLILN